MNSNVLLADTAYGLKRIGEFDKALLAYAKEYRKNVEQQGSRYLARLCFEQIVDIILLKYLRDQKTFVDSRYLLDALEHEVRQVFAEIKIRDVENFEEFFDRIRRKLFPRGRGKSAFSVDRNLLLRSTEYQRQSTAEYVREDKTDYTV